MNIEEYRKQYIKWHAAYERRAYKIFRKALLETISSMPTDNLTYDNYKQLIPLNITTQQIQKAYVDVYTQIGLIHGKRVGYGINRDLKDFGLSFFNEIFQNTIVAWVRENCGSRIISVADTLAKRIISLVEEALGENLTLEQMQRFIRQSIDNGSALSRFEVLRIARTETGAAANHSALVAGETSGIVLEKVWISSQNDRTRRKPRDQFDHLHMNGVSVAQNEFFVMNSKGGIIDKMEFPCDPKGSAGNVIQCRCAVALRPKRDINGMVIRR